MLDQVTTDMRAAMKAGDKERVGALRMLVSALQLADKEGDGDAVAVLRRERKRRLESAKAYREGGREDLAGPEEREAEIIAGYLPAELDDTELDNLVDAAIAEAQAAGPQDMGKVMKAVMPKVAGRADGARVSARVKERLARA